MSTANAQHFNVGSETCGGECHEAEMDVWESSPHQLSFDKFDDPSDELTEKVDAILAAVGDDDMTESGTCTSCHFTMVKEAADEDAFADSGPSCESCHGSGSTFKDIHSDEDEDRDARMAKSESMGMIRPHATFAIATNCNGCHAMARDDIDGATIDAMIDAGHPINPEFELVQYSQGSVRHRFYEPDTSVNAEMNASELSNFYVQGQIAQFIAAHESIDKSSNAEYKAAMSKRKDSAMAVIKAVPGGDALIASPSVANAAKLASALKGQDLSATVGSMLPNPSDYK